MDPAAVSVSVFYSDVQELTPLQNPYHIHDPVFVIDTDDYLQNSAHYYRVQSEQDILDNLDPEL